MKKIALLCLVFLISLPVLFAVGAQEVSGARTYIGEGENPGGPEETLPVTGAALFTSGVGYFERTGTVGGDQSVTLRFPVADIDDLLKSLVVQDLDGGRVGEIRYGARDPLARSLKSFSLDLSGSPDLAGLIAQARGEEVSITFGGGDGLIGTILGIQTRSTPEGEKIPVLMLNMAEGLRTIAFSEMESINFTNPEIRKELQQALDLIAENRNSDITPVSIRFSGTGERRVQAAYIVETPVWKTSYRLLLGEKGEHYLQGWAVVENTGEEDWKDIDLSLVAGRPISFTMALSRPLYISRPEVAVETESAPGPQRYDEAYAPAPEVDYGAVYESAAPMAKSALRASGGAATPPRGVETAAVAESAGEFFVYHAAEPVSLPRRSSALVPIIGSAVEGERVSVYDRGVHSERPLNGIILKNTTGLHLMGGPITVFEEGTYAGDALIDDVRPEAERLLTFSMDLDTRVLTDEAGGEERITRLRIYHGALIASRLQKKTRTYTVNRPAGNEKTVLIIHPRSQGWDLSLPEGPDEVIGAAYRFRVSFSPGEIVKKLTVTEERTVEQSVTLRNMGSDTVLFYLRQQVISNGVKQALERVQTLSRQAAEATAERERIEKAIRDIESGQGRIRSNMANLDRDSSLYRRYVAALTSQEDELESLRSSLDSARKEENRRRSSLEDYISDLEVK